MPRTSLAVSYQQDGCVMGTWKNISLVVWGVKRRFRSWNSCTRSATRS